MRLPSGLQAPDGSFAKPCGTLLMKRRQAFREIGCLSGLLLQLPFGRQCRCEVAVGRAPRSLADQGMAVARPFGQLLRHGLCRFLHRAIVNQPRILLADEPTGALDSATSKQVMELFGDLHAEGMTLLLVTHDAKVASYAERTVTFQDGRIVSDSREAAHV